MKLDAWQKCLAVFVLQVAAKARRGSAPRVWTLAGNSRPATEDENVARRQERKALEAMAAALESGESAGGGTVSECVRCKDLEARLAETEGRLATESAERIRCRDGWAKCEAKRTETQVEARALRREALNNARELFEIIAENAGTLAGHRARAKGWLARWGAAAPSAHKGPRP